MIRARIGAIVAAGAMSVLLSASQLSLAGAAAAKTPAKPAAKSSIKKLMGENFGGLQTILLGLISGNYAAVPAQADVIHQHATELQNLVPESARHEREKFLAYATNLGAHAQDMKTIAEALMKRDRERPVPGTDSLREALASHYGGMVTMCVACHNRFRPMPVKLK